MPETIRLFWLESFLRWQTAQNIGAGLLMNLRKFGQGMSHPQPGLRGEHLPAGTAVQVHVQSIVLTNEVNDTHVTKPRKSVTLPG